MAAMSSTGVQTSIAATSSVTAAISAANSGRLISVRVCRGHRLGGVVERDAELTFMNSCVPSVTGPRPRPSIVQLATPSRGTEPLVWLPPLRRPTATCAATRTRGRFLLVLTVRCVGNQREPAYSLACGSSVELMLRLDARCAFELEAATFGGKRHARSLVARGT